MKLIGISFDGNINHLPDYLCNYDKYENNIIYFNEKIPKTILWKLFLIMAINHNSGNGHSCDYSAECGEIVPENWKEYKAIYEGFNSGYGDIKGKFRPEIRQVLPFIICNYRQNNDIILEIRNIEIIVKDKPQFIYLVVQKIIILLYLLLNILKLKVIH